MKKFILTGLVALLALSMASTANANVFFGLRCGGDKVKIDNTSLALEEGDSDLMFGSFVGYHYSFFRIEGEYIYRPERKFVGNTIKEELHTAMGNLYFSPPIRSFLHPYVMGGAGLAIHQISVGTDSNRDKAFAWQLGVGIELEFTENVFLDVGGRVSDFGDAEIGNQKYGVEGHSIFGGLRFEY